MVNSCSAYGCNTRWKKGVGFFKFPKDEIRRVQWMIAVRRSNWLPSDSACLCYKHFQTGRPSRNENHPDYIPNIFVFKEDQTERSVDSYENSKSWLEKYDRSKKDAAERNSRRTKAPVSPIEFSGSDPDVPQQPSRDESHPLVVTPHVVVLKKPQTRRSAESYEKRKSCQENYNGSESDADEPNSRRTEAAGSPSSGSDPHLPRCNKCLCKDAEIYFLQKEKEESLNEIKMLQLEVQTLREEIQKYKFKKR